MRSLLLCLLFLGMSPTATLPDLPTADLTIYHRRNAQTHQEWEGLTLGDSVQYYVHGAVPYFRMYTLAAATENTAFTAVTLTSYAADTVVREITWKSRTPVRTTRHISEMNRYTSGLLSAVEYEVLTADWVYLDADSTWHRWPEPMPGLVILLDK